MFKGLVKKGKTTWLFVTKISSYFFTYFYTIVYDISIVSFICIFFSNTRFK